MYTFDSSAQEAEAGTPGPQPDLHRWAMGDVMGRLSNKKQEVKRYSMEPESIYKSILW